MSDKKSFLLSKTWKPMIDAMTRDDKADLLQAIYDYACDGEVFFEDKTSAVYPIFALIKEALDEDDRKYEETCEKNRRNRTKDNDRQRPSTTVNDRSPVVTDKDMDLDMDRDMEKDLEKPLESVTPIGVPASCQEFMPEPEADVDPVILNDGSEWRPSVYLYEKYASTYTGIDVAAEFRKMSTWTLSNPQKRKTKRGVTRFVNSWLDRAQSNGRSPTYTEAIANRMSVVDQWLEESG